MNTIYEHDLLELKKENRSAITKFELVQTDDFSGRWYLHVHFKTKKSTPKSPAILTTVRDAARSWVDINSAIRWMKHFATSETEIMIKLQDLDSSS